MGSVFLVNLPVIALFLCFAPVLLREVRAPRAGRIDAISVVASAVGLLLVIYGIKHAAAEGLTVPAVVSVILGTAVLAWFGLRQRRLEHPLIDFSLFRDRTFTVAVITGLLALAAWSAAAYLAGIYLQSVLDIPVLQAALLALPGAVVLTTTCIVTPMLVDRVGKRTALLVCHFSIAAGLLLLLPTSLTSGIGWYVASTAVAGIGSRAAGRAKSAGAKAGHAYLHSAIDGFSRLAYTEPLADEKGATAAAFLARAKVWFAAHGIDHIHRIVTDNGACYRSGDFARIVGRLSRHQKAKPYTPRHTGKVERYQRILAEELLYAREFTNEDARSAAIAVWNIHYNYHRPHSGAGGRPPASRLRAGVTNVQPSYT